MAITAGNLVRRESCENSSGCCGRGIPVVSAGETWYGLLTQRDGPGYVGFNHPLANGSTGFLSTVDNDNEGFTTKPRYMRPLSSVPSVAQRI